MKTTDPRHGTVNGYVNQRCRCAECKAAWAQDFRRWRSIWLGQLPKDDFRHGSAATYNNYGCRCADCSAAKRASRKRVAS